MLLMSAKRYRSSCQSTHNPGKSWNMKPSWKAMGKSWILVNLLRNHAKLIFQGKGNGKVMESLNQKVTKYFLSRSLMYIF